MRQRVPLVATLARLHVGVVLIDRDCECRGHRRRIEGAVYAARSARVPMTKAYDVADDACNVDQVSEVYSTSGQYDLLMKCDLDEKTDIGHFVTSKIQTLAGVKDTFTLITFKAFS